MLSCSEQRAKNKIQIIIIIKLLNKAAMHMYLPKIIYMIKMTTMLNSDVACTRILMLFFHS